MNRRELFAVGGVGMVGLLFPRKLEAESISQPYGQQVPLLDRGWSHEKMARYILDSNSPCYLGGGSHDNAIYPHLERMQVHVQGSIITVINLNHPPHDPWFHNEFDISGDWMRTVKIGWSGRKEEYFGRMGERWFKLGNDDE